jgi:hypothetical protein
MRLLFRMGTPTEGLGEGLERRLAEMLGLHGWDKGWEALAPVRVIEAIDTIKGMYLGERPDQALFFPGERHVHLACPGAAYAKAEYDTTDLLVVPLGSPEDGGLWSRELKQEGDKRYRDPAFTLRSPREGYELKDTQPVPQLTWLTGFKVVRQGETLIELEIDIPKDILQSSADNWPYRGPVAYLATRK